MSKNIRSRGHERPGFNQGDMRDQVSTSKLTFVLVQLAASCGLHAQSYTVFITAGYSNLTHGQQRRLTLAFPRMLCSCPFLLPFQ